MAYSQTKENTFAEPWNKSDIILILEDSEEREDPKHSESDSDLKQSVLFHVHRSILSIQSPVFEAMLNSNFKEATQTTIELKNKKYLPMLKFLKLLYPSNMIEGDKVVISNRNVFPILEIADEFQAIAVIKQCIDELEITPENVLEVLPYASRWHQSALPKLTEVVNYGVSATRLKKFCSEMKDDHDSTKTTEMLWSKIHYLEKAAGKRHEIITALLYSMAKKLYDNGQPSISLRDFKSVKSTGLLKEYQKKILDKTPSFFLPSSIHGLAKSATYEKISLKFLLEGDAILTASRE